MIEPVAVAVGSDEKSIWRATVLHSSLRQQHESALKHAMLVALTTHIADNPVYFTDTLRTAPSVAAE